MLRVAIVGGGPGGLFAAYLLEQKLSQDCSITLFEASGRLGGKVVTRQFQAVPIPYEAGVAELYDYSHLGPDPLRQLVHKLGLKTLPMAGPAVVLEDNILRKRSDLRRHGGNKTFRALENFHHLCRSYCCPADYYEGHWQDDNSHPWARQTFAAMLAEIPDETARRFIQVAVHTDLATEPHLTNGLNGLKNVLMDDPRYLRLYSIDGGLERLVDSLRSRISARIELNRPVAGIARNLDGSYQVSFRRSLSDADPKEEENFDLVILALPNYWLGSLKWGSERLARAMQKHCAHYDRPGHYLRISILFQKPFWRRHLPDSYFMLDAFGGCCVYDESSRFDCGSYGVLGWLLAGNEALALNNIDDQILIDQALASLPSSLKRGRELFLEGQVQRWLGTVNALPGGVPVREPKSRHVPEPRRHPGLFVVGDYLFDSTLNGVLDSADIATDLVLTHLMKEKHRAACLAGIHANGALKTSSKRIHPNRDKLAQKAGIDNSRSGNLNKAYYDFYDGERTYQESFKEYFDEDYTVRLFKVVWGAAPPYRLLDCGSANGLTLAALARLGVDAWGVENSPHIHGQTSNPWKSKNLFGDVRNLPFKEGEFDFVYDTCLCYLPEKDVDRAILELHRVVKKGVFFGGITSDMTREVIEKHDLFYGVQTLCTLWEWSEKFLRNGFRLAITDPKVLARAWQVETRANEGDFPWYPSPEAMRYCFFTKITQDKSL